MVNSIQLATFTKQLVMDHFVFILFVGRFCGLGEIQSSLITAGHRMLITYMASPNQHNHRGFNATFEG